MLRTICLLIPITALPGLAWAHGGHLADLAGHSHWAGVAALAGAAAVAAVAAKLRDRKNDNTDEESEQDPAAEAETAQ